MTKRSAVALGAVSGVALLAAVALADEATLNKIPHMPLQAPPHAAEVTFLEGHAGHTPVGAASATPLKTGDQLTQGEIVQTESRSRLELRLDDKSLLRLGPGSQLKLTEANFASDGTRKLSVKLFFGNLWARVTSAVNGDQRFAVETENAVAGVRGTTFQVDARTDKSVLVRVFDGAVAVAQPQAEPAKNPAGTLRHEIAGPQEVTRAAWEKLVGAQMQIVVSKKGVPGEPAPIAPADIEKDTWVKWNQERDAK